MPDLRTRRLLGASLLALASGSMQGRTAQAQDKSQDQTKSGLKVAMLLPGSINDQSWNAQGHAALAALKQSGVETAFSENVGAAEQVEAMRDYARRGFGAVIGHSGRFLSAAQRVGPEFAACRFIVGSGSAGAGRNVASVDYDNAQMGYLVGVLAARMSKTGKIASVNGLEGLPNIVAQVGGFRQGVRSVLPGTPVQVTYLPSMEDAAMAREAALAAIGGGADFVFGKLNAGHSGIVQAAQEKGVHTSGRSMDHAKAAPDAVLTTIAERWQDMYAAAVKAAASDTLAPALQLYGFEAAAGSGATLRYSDALDYNPAVPAPVADELAGIRARFAAGELKLTVTREDARGGSA